MRLVYMCCECNVYFVMCVCVKGVCDGCVCDGCTL